MKSLRILAIAAVLTCTQAWAGEKSIKIGILGDQSGPYSDLGGAGSVLAAQMAADDYGGKALGKPIEIVAADMQNKPDVASSMVRRRGRRRDRRRAAHIRGARRAKRCT